MSPDTAASYSLADFYYSDDPDPLSPSAEFQEWCAEADWAMSLYEQSLAAGPKPKTEIASQGENQSVINLSSYNYLGLGSHPKTIAAAKSALDVFGTGSCGSPVLSGMTVLHRQLEQSLSSFLGYPQTMLFNSGFGGAIGILVGLMRRGDVVVLDEKSHICWVDGAKAATARTHYFKHNDADSLDAALAKYNDKRRVVIVEGIYSMDGDVAALENLLPVAQKHGVGVIIDEAHSILTIGENGRGTAEHLKIEDGIILKYGTFSKAFAGVGGFASGPTATLQYLRFYANSYSFSCSLPPASVSALIAALAVSQEEPERRQRLQANALYFREQLNALGFNTGLSCSQVVPIIIGSNRQRLYEAGNELRARGLFLAPVDYPSVPEHELRFRASITSEHDRSTLDESLNILCDILKPDR
ncbi:MAG TPA: pyridoxal phosphate-dependent aminotransferase family protein [Hyphomicrobiaceae bacterium]|nr:pyridoxal phosphate-dependent aminotransferase family protein [Hyphomicrobiaceae bacterium]